MRSTRFLLALVVAAASVAAAPIHAQRAADPAPGGSHAQAAPAPREIAPASPLLSASRDLPAALRPPRVETHDAAAERRLSVAGHTAVGAGAGALAGVLASAAMFAFDEDCRPGHSMCGLAIPVFIGGGALTGGAVGLVVGLTRNR
ncbi:MAG TPA: hypothetical protein VFY65_01375 [Longimicrobium sp.]|nr:hypothetical protein [Longimicrobium sp.]